MKKTKPIVLAVGLILLIIVAYFSYNKLSEIYKQQEKEKITKEENNGSNQENQVADGANNETGNDLNNGANNGNNAEQLEKAKDFTVTDIDGNEVKLSDFIGRPIVLNFWASWCGPCKYEMPHFQTLYEELGEDVQFLMVNLADGYQETVESGSEYVEKNNYTFPVYYDTSLEAAYNYTIYSIPVTYFINRDGEIVEYVEGFIDEEDTLRSKINNLLEE